MNKDEFQVIISKGMSPIECLRLAKELLLMQLDHSLKIDKVEKVLCVDDLCEAFPLYLLDIVADLLGVPEDTTAEMDEETGYYPDDGYCRDWVWDCWSPTRHQEATDDPDEYVMSYIMYITKELSKGENNEC